MTPFGFSVGDFVAAISLTVKISKALRETSGATTDFRLVLQDLQSLQQILEALQALRPASASLSHVNVIRGMALTCLVPLREFAEKIDKSYTSALGAASTRAPFGCAGKKMQWAVFAADEVAKFRAVIAAKVVSISLLLGVFNSEAISRAESQNENTRVALMAKAAEDRDHLEKSLSELVITHREGLSDEILKSRKDIQGIVSKFRRDLEAHQETLISRSDKSMVHLGMLSKRLERAKNHTNSHTQEIVGLCFGIKLNNDHMARIAQQRFQQTESQLMAIKSRQEEANSRMSASFESLSSQLSLLRAIGISLLGNLIPFSERVLHYLRKSMEANMEMSALLLKIQASIPQGIFVSRQDCICFEDVLGRTKNLPYDFFRHWDVFESMLRCEFKGLPGEQKVLNGDYIIMDSVSYNARIERDTWQQSVFPGTKVAMSVVMQFFGARSGLCPRPSCSGKADLCKTASVLHCPDCGLAFIPEKPEDVYQRQKSANGNPRKKPQSIRESTDPLGELPSPALPERVMYLRGRPYSLTSSRRVRFEAALTRLDAERALLDVERELQFRRMLQTEDQEIMVFRRIHILKVAESPSRASQDRSTYLEAEGISGITARTISASVRLEAANLRITRTLQNPL